LTVMAGSTQEARTRVLQARLALREF
jgi:hypothetical protein